VRALGAPLEVLDIPDRRVREIAGFDLLLVRPDLHVAWRANRLADDVGTIAAITTGRAGR
jgi:hypothetical protein